jgi:hypothetical protein
MSGCGQNSESVQLHQDNILMTGSLTVMVLGPTRFRVGSASSPTERGRGRGITARRRRLGATVLLHNHTGDQPGMI